MLLKGIENEQLIERTDGWVLLKRINENKQATKIYKMVNSIQQESVSNLYYELEMIKLLQSKYTLQPIQIEQHDMNHLLVFQDDESVSFNQYLTKPLPILTFLKIALEIANIFIDLHRSSIVYRNVHRRNFLINDNNELIFNEIEDSVGARALYELTNINIASLYIEHIYQTLLRL